MTATTPYTGIPNTFRRDLLARKPLIGCWSSLANPTTTEVLGLASFDWLLLDGEHAPNDVGTLHPATYGAEGQPQCAGGASALERRRRHQAIARCGVLQLPDPVR